ncbi:MAG: hypothetical protein E6K53_07090 [Gammaproteobacteria bacterium]|nr:MAG: hypothetical protein E6K53_07090 [Gammaproteobacteria bacterium]
MKKVYFCGLSQLVASLGLSQGAVAATTVVVGSCTITGVSGINHDYNSNTVTVTGGTLGSGCTAGNGGGGGGGSTTSLSYTLGTTLSAPMAINWSSSDAGVSCTVGNASGFVTNPTAANGWTLSTPTTAGSYSFPITCTSTTANITSVVASPSSVSLTVSNAVVQGACDPSQKSDNLYGVVLARQCTGNVTYSGSRFGKAAYSGNVYKLDDLLTDATHPGPFPKYVSGYSLTPSINTGQFIALAFTPGSRGGQMQFTNDPSFGDGGVISISTQPGVFSQGAAICSQNYGAGNSFTVGTVGTGSDCVVAAGQTYYLNFAAVNQFGQNMCFNGTPNNCATTTVSYSELAQAL